MLDVSSSTLLYSNLIFHLSFLNLNFIPFMCLQKFSLEEEADMPFGNLFETIHNIWLQQFGNTRTYLFATMFDDYVRTFKSSSLYYAFLQGGASRTNLDKNELHLCMVNQSRDLIQIVATVNIPHIWKVRKCLDQPNTRQTFHLGQKQIHTNMIM